MSRDSDRVINSPCAFASGCLARRAASISASSSGSTLTVDTFRHVEICENLCFHKIVMVKSKNFLRTGRTIAGVRTRIPYRLSAGQHFGLLSRYNPRKVKQVKPQRPSFVRRVRGDPYSVGKANAERLRKAPAAKGEPRVKLEVRARERLQPVASVPVFNEASVEQPPAPIRGKEVLEEALKVVEPKHRSDFVEKFKKSVSVPVKGSSGVTLGNYTGPGNSLYRGVPVSVGDALAMYHDHGYDELLKNRTFDEVYGLWNEADELTWNQLSKLGHMDKEAHAIYVFLAAKRAFSG